VNCSIEAFNAAGESEGQEPIPLRMVSFPTGPFVDAGKQIRFDWYLKEVSTPAARSLRGYCEATDYGGNPPI
jgi:hypothetical protein